MAKDLIRYFRKDGISMGNKHMERSLTSSVIRETQKAAIKCNNIPIQMIKVSPAISYMDKWASTGNYSLSYWWEYKLAQSVKLILSSLLHCFMSYILYSQENLLQGINKGNVYPLWPNKRRSNESLFIIIKYWEQF